MVERDYILTHVVESLGLLTAPGGLVFMGGTALRLCFFDDFRYSADLDFSLVDLTDGEAVDLIRAALADTLARTGVPRLELVEGPPREIQYVGPLGRARRIKLDLANDELVLQTQSSSLIARFPDQATPSSSITTYTLVEVSAEKLRCVIQRLQCRDPFDLHRLFVREGIDVGEAWELFERKAAQRGIQPDTFGSRLDAREPEYERRWERELLEHVGHVPHFERTLTGAAARTS